MDISIEKFEDAKKYWLEKLSGMSGEIELITDFPKSKHYHEADYKISCGKEQAKNLLRISKNNDLSLFVVLLVTLKILLFKMTLQDDLLTASPIYSKSNIEYNKFVLFRDILTPGLTFKELLMKVTQTVRDGYLNQFYPIKKIIDFLEIENEKPLFRVFLLLENLHKNKFIEDIQRDFRSDIIFFFKREGEDLAGRIIYNSHLFSPDSIANLSDCYFRVLRQALKDKDVTLADIQLISAAEKQKLLVDFNNNAVAYREDSTIYDLFREQVQQTPAHTALIYENVDFTRETSGETRQEVTYQELDEMSDQLACLLQEKGVMRDGIVGIMAERSIEMIVGLLGIMKAGAAYLPIDAEYPGDRIKYMLEDSHVKLLLYQECLKDRITFNVEDVVDAAEVECLVLDKKNFSHRRQAKPKNIYQKGDLAYIIFTSGSTGKPKGVMVQHNSIVNTLLWRKSYYEFGPGDAVLQVPSFSFDSSVEDIFTPLISGCKLVLIRPENMFDLAYVRKVIPGNGVNHFLLVPGFYKTFLGAIPGVLTGFKSITVAGDNFTRELVKEHFEKLPDVGLFNEYGPTENSVCATVYRFHRHHTRVLIGSPINNVKCYILDKEGRLSAVNTPGELYLAGSSLARAYLNRPGLTAERFVDNPFEAGKKMYRTGDMARWLPDGNIEFFGRIDHQVKIRGFRIELGEIESQLQRIEGIKEAVVIAREETGTEKKLTAYIVAEQPIDVPVTREHLLKVLPDYMVPSYFIRVEEILLTPNGKVDRRTLSSHEVRLGTGVEYVAPTNQLEKTIANIWTEVLQLDKVGIHDNFFDLGGDSMNIIQVSLKLKEAFERDIRVVTMFRYTTIHSLAGYLSQQDTDSMTSPEEIDETIEMMKNSNLMLMGDDDE